MHFYQSSLALFAGSAMAFALPLCAQSAHPSRSADAMNANQRAANLMNTINQDEVNEAQMIQGRTNNTDVKDFASMIINDHQANQNDLQSIAGQANIDLHNNDALHQQDQSEARQLKNAPVARANRTYLRDEVTDHRNAIQRLQRLQDQVTDPALKHYIRQSIPMMQKHLDRAQSLEKSVGR